MAKRTLVALALLFCLLLSSRAAAVDPPMPPEEEEPVVEEPSRPLEPGEEQMPTIEDMKCQACDVATKLWFRRVIAMEVECAKAKDATDVHFLPGTLGKDVPSIFDATADCEASEGALTAFDAINAQGKFLCKDFFALFPYIEEFETEASKKAAAEGKAAPEDEDTPDPLPAAALTILEQACQQTLLRPQKKRNKVAQTLRNIVGNLKPHRLIVEKAFDAAVKRPDGGEQLQVESPAAFDALAQEELRRIVYQALKDVQAVACNDVCGTDFKRPDVEYIPRGWAANNKRLPKE